MSLGLAAVAVVGFLAFVYDDLKGAIMYLYDDVRPLVQIPGEIVSEVKDYLIEVDVTAANTKRYAQMWRGTRHNKLNKMEIVKASCKSEHFDDALLDFFDQNFINLENADELETKGQWEDTYYDYGKGYTRVGYIIARKIEKTGRYDLLVACKQHNYKVAWKAAIWNAVSKPPPAEIDRNGEKKSIEDLIHQQSKIDLVLSIEQEYGKNGLIGVGETNED
eukprot:CAMPEP_0201567194 /NCGR_PEP_ID=MMETSP0190_2-20130828/7574_1 /ASSEMBLY_ACC=CAM_ASM_000263 /TAXON_ID=37353 /ORGANISM="Rosalina sp." /LENGTH=219 /DNA_ID=CAMNT_0047986893 /DNA_START=26 /DNA_END=685 /DNA_ORIENTATION=-